MTSRLTVLLLFAFNTDAHADPSSEAERLFEEGQKAFDQAHYEDALSAWEQSWTISHAPPLLYNLAQAHRLRGHDDDCPAARELYQRFVAASGPSEQRDLSEGYISELARCSPAEPAPVSNTHDRRRFAVALAAGGVALMGTGIAFGYHASTLSDDVTRACAVSCDWSAENSVDASARRDSTVAWTLGLLGATAMAGSALVYWYGLRDRGVRVAPLAAHGTATGAVMVWSRPW